jgi:tetratricopeptide (TPR) repeat protein
MGAIPEKATQGRAVGGMGERVPRRRRIVYALIAIVLPFLLLLLAEGIARAFAWGGYPPIVRFAGNDGELDWYTTYRPGVDAFFYEKRSRTGGMREAHFNTPKPAGTVRILFLGGSAMQGWPQPRPLTNGAFLESMLAEVWDDGRGPEVINMGATAMASFPAVYFLDAMLEHDLDLVVVMTGNNEFYGAYGVSSLHTAGTSPAGMRTMHWVRGLALTQWLGATLAAPPTTDESGRRTLMELVAVNQQVGPHDPLRRAAERTLRANLTAIVRTCTSHDIPVVVCTLPTNERALAPVGADLPPPLPPDRAGAFERLLAKGREAADAADAVTSLQSAIEHYDDNAESHFLLGRALAKLGREEEALREYTRSRDLDTMPWRAVSSANRTARSMADLGAVVCDMEAAFREASPEGAIGWELMDDHVHMSVAGQALFARTLARTMTTLPAPLKVDSARLEGLPDWPTYAQRGGQSIFTDYTVARRMLSLFETSFLSRSNPAAREHWQNRCDDLLGQMAPLDRDAVEQWKDPGLHVTNNRPLSFVVGYYRMMAGDYEGALPLLETARASLREISLWRLQLGWYSVRCRRALHDTPTPDDRRICQETIHIGRTLDRLVGFPTPEGPAYLGLTYHAVGKYDAAIYYLDNAVRYVQGADGADVVYALADSLMKTGEPDRARKLLNLALKDEAFAGTARRLLERFDALDHDGE